MKILNIELFPHLCILHKLWFNRKFYLIQRALKIIYEITCSNEATLPTLKQQRNLNEIYDEMCSNGLNGTSASE